MKIRIRRKKTTPAERYIRQTKHLRKKRVGLPRSVRWGLVGVLSLILLFSVVTTIVAYQKPTTTHRTVTKSTYYQNGDFSYTVYLKNNTVYGKRFLVPQDNAIYFRNIVDYINANFTYTFQTFDENSKVVTLDATGSYTITAEVQTELWKKSEILVPSTPFDVTGDMVTFTEAFPIDFRHFENITAEINTETGVSSTNPFLYIQCTIELTAKTADGSIFKSFRPSINVTLTKKTIDITEGMANQFYGKETETVQEFNQNVVDEKNTWRSASIVCAFILVIFVIVTASTSTRLTDIEQKIKKIKKKYGEWMVETNQLPISDDVQIIPVSSMDDLMKTSEEIRKPIVYYSSSNPEKHAFYVLDNCLWYEYALRPEQESGKKFFLSKLRRR